jgi:hypothetical protein
MRSNRNVIQQFSSSCWMSAVKVKEGNNFIKLLVEYQNLNNYL